MFQIGQKVECIDDEGGMGIIHNGMVCTVSAIFQPEADGYGFGLLLVEIKPPLGARAFTADRWRPIVEKKTDISTFEEILRRETFDDLERV
jgi:hypothetical protein